jgi:hypothetical protein
MPATCCSLQQLERLVVGTRAVTRKNNQCIGLDDSSEQNSVREFGRLILVHTQDDDGDPTRDAP